MSDENDITLNNIIKNQSLKKSPLIQNHEIDSDIPSLDHLNIVNQLNAHTQIPPQMPIGSLIDFNVILPSSNLPLINNINYQKIEIQPRQPLPPAPKQPDVSPQIMDIWVGNPNIIRIAVMSKIILDYNAKNRRRSIGGSACADGHCDIRQTDQIAMDTDSFRCDLVSVNSAREISCEGTGETYQTPGEGGYWITENYRVIYETSVTVNVSYDYRVMSTLECIHSPCPRTNPLAPPTFNPSQNDQRLSVSYQTTEIITIEVNEPRSTWHWTPTIPDFKDN